MLFRSMQDVVAALDNESGVVYSSPVPLQDPSRVMGYTPGLGVPVSYSQANNPNGQQGVPAAMHSPRRWRKPKLEVSPSTNSAR